MLSIRILQRTIILGKEVKIAKLKLRLIEFFKIYVRKTCTSIFLFIKLEQEIVAKRNKVVH